MSRTKALVGALLVVAMGVTVLATTFTDAFTGTGALSASWTLALGSPQRTSGELTSNGLEAASAAFTTGTGVGTDQYAQIKITNIETSGLVCALARASGISLSFVFYGACAGSSGAVTVYKTASDITPSGIASFSAGDTIGLVVTGTGTVTIQVQKNGVNTGSAATDASGPLNSGTGGIYLYGPVTSTSKGDDFASGDVGGGGGGASCAGKLSLLGVGCFVQGYDRGLAARGFPVAMSRQSATPMSATKPSTQSGSTSGMSAKRMGAGMGDVMRRILAHQTGAGL